MSETQCPKCSMPWCDHVGDGHDEPICPAPNDPLDRCPACREKALRAEVAAMREALGRFQWSQRIEATNSWGEMEPYFCCPECDQVKERGHAPDCRVGMLLARAAEGEGKK